MRKGSSMKKIGLLKTILIPFVFCAATALNSPAQTLTVLHNFAGPDGGNPTVGLVLATDGNFYGTTSTGGNNGTNAGTAFRITTSGTLTTLYNFCQQQYCGDGAQPMQIIQGRDGNFYGVTISGGNGETGCGTVFKLTLSGNRTVLHSFCLQTSCTDGPEPAAALVRGSDGNFYGTTSAGGANYAGVIFKVTPNGTYTILHSFAGGEG